MTVYKRGGVYWYEFIFAGKRVREPAKTTSKALAKRAKIASAGAGARPRRTLLTSQRIGSSTAWQLAESFRNDLLRNLERN